MGSSSLTTLIDVASCTVTTPKMGDPCQRCRKRPSTTSWVGDGGSLALSHGFYQLWCEVCVFSEQLKYARKVARGIPALERRLARAKAAAKKARS